MLTRSRRMHALVLGLALLAGLPDLRWCRLSWADVPPECWTDLPIACAARPASCAPPSACDAATAPGSCEVAFAFGTNPDPDPACDVRCAAVSGTGDAACAATCADPGTPAARAWCPDDALGAPAVAGAGLDDEPQPVALAAPGEPDVPADCGVRAPAENHPPPRSADLGPPPPIRGPPLTPLRLV